MKTRHLALTVVASFLISLLFSIFFTQVATGTLSETRRSALIETLSERQIKELGAFPEYHYPWTGGYWSERQYVSEFTTADSLLILKTLDALDYVDVDQAIEYIASKQYKDGGFGAYFGFDGTFLGNDLYSTYYMVHVLKMFNALDKINQTLLMNFVLERYKASIGAFHELLTEAYNKEYAMSRFALVFRSYYDYMAYAIPNIVTTYSGVSILAELDVLNLINTTKTFEWIMACKAENGMFRPFPNATYQPLPEWSPLKTNPFEVDRYSTGIPYTFAAVAALKALGRLDAINQEERQQVKNYTVACQTKTGLFNVHQDYDYHSTAFTYYAIMTLYYLDMLDETPEVIRRVENYFQEAQTLYLDNSWPLPKPGDLYDIPKSDYYGLHKGDSFPILDSYYAITIFNATGSLSLLDQPTPRVFITYFNLVVLSALISGVVIAIALVWKTAKSKLALSNLSEWIETACRIKLIKRLNSAKSYKI